MSAKESNDIEPTSGLLSNWQDHASKKPAQTATASASTLADNLPLPAFDPGWAAGMLDGEGCIHIVHQGGRRGGPPSYQLRVSLSQNDLEVLEHFRRGIGVGGNIYEVPRLPSHSRQVYVLNFGTAQAIGLLQQLGPRLVRKRAELALARRFWVECMPGSGPGRRALSPEVRALREWLYHEMMRVKRAPPPALAKALPVVGGAQ